MKTMKISIVAATAVCLALSGVVLLAQERWQQARRNCSSDSTASEQEPAIIFNDLTVRVPARLLSNA